MLNSRDISRLRADVAANARILIALAAADGVPVLITGTVRDEEYQRHCYNSGTANTPYPSFHSVAAGLAFDVCKNVKGQEYSDGKFWEYAGSLGKRLGFTWGGDWKGFSDKPHFQWDAGGKFTAQMVRGGKYPAAMPLYEKEEDTIETRYETVTELPDWARPTIEKLVDRKILKGGGAGLDLSMDMIRMFVLNDRAGLYGGVN